MTAAVATFDGNPALEQRAGRASLAGRLWAAVRRVFTRTGRAERQPKLLERGAAALPAAGAGPTEMNWVEVQTRAAVQRAVRDAFWSAMKRPTPLAPTPPSEMQARELPWGEWQDHPGVGVTIERVVNIFRQAECGYPAPQCDLIDDLVEGDCHLRNLFEQRNLDVSGKDCVLQAGAGDDLAILAARALAFALAKLPLTEFFEHQLTYNKYGWAATEIEWGLMAFEGRTWVVPVWFANVPARRFVIDTKTNELLLVTERAPEGERLIPGKWIITCRPGPLARGALMRTAAFPAVYKRFANRDWVIYSHKFGLPLVLVKYGDESTPLSDVADDPSRIVCEEIVENIGNDGGAVVPKSIEVEVKDASRNADASGTHGGFIGHQNREMSKLVNGATLANDNSESGTGSYAHAEVHASTRWGNVVADAKRLQDSLRLQIGDAFLVYNGLAGATAGPVWKFQVARDDTPTTRVEIADVFVNKLGGAVSKTQLGQDLGFREPLNDDDRLPGAPKPEPATPAKAAA
jgi:phage gp29-like protein